MRDPVLDGLLGAGVSNTLSPIRSGSSPSCILSEARQHALSVRLATGSHHPSLRDSHALPRTQCSTADPGRYVRPELSRFAPLSLDDLTHFVPCFDQTQKNQVRLQLRSACCNSDLLKVSDHLLEFCCSWTIWSFDDGEQCVLVVLSDQSSMRRCLRSISLISALWQSSTGQAPEYPVLADTNGVLVEFSDSTCDQRSDGIFGGKLFAG